MLVLVFLICTYRGPRNERGNTTALYYNSNNSAMFLARENKKSETYLQLMSFIQMTKATNIYILHENKECMELHNTLLHNIIILIIFNIAKYNLYVLCTPFQLKYFRRQKGVALKTM